MPAQPAHERLARLHEAQQRFYAGGPADGLREVLTVDIRWTVPGDNPIAGTYAGIEQVLAYFAKRRDLASRTFRMQLRELLTGSGEHLAALTDGTAVLGGVEETWSTVGLYRLRGERVAACWLLPLDPPAFDRIWSAGAEEPG